MPRLDNYNYMKILTDWVGEENIFKKKFVWPRQMEIHLPSNKKIACDFHCYYCQGSALDMNLGLDEKKALKLMEEIGPNAFEYYIYGGNYTEPLLNPYFMDFMRATKKNKANFVFQNIFYFVSVFIFSSCLILLLLNYIFDFQKIFGVSSIKKNDFYLVIIFVVLK